MWTFRTPSLISAFTLSASALSGWANVPRIGRLFRGVADIFQAAKRMPYGRKAIAYGGEEWAAIEARATSYRLRRNARFWGSAAREDASPGAHQKLMSIETNVSELHNFRDFRAKRGELSRHLQL